MTEVKQDPRMIQEGNFKIALGLMRSMGMEVLEIAQERQIARLVGIGNRLVEVQEILGRELQTQEEV